MTIAVGIVLAFVAMLSWGVGDFLIQKSTRKLGNWETLFIMTTFGAVVLLPFVFHNLPAVFSSESKSLGILVLASIVLFVAALIDFEGLRVGKLAIVEPIWSLEIVVSALLAFAIIGEHLTVAQFILITMLVIFLLLVAFRQQKFSRQLLLEKGVLIAFIGALVMGAANFFMGWAGRITDPLMVNFFTDAFLAIGTGIYLLGKGKLRHIWSDFSRNLGLVLPMSISDKVAWIAFVTSMTLAPIGVATALSESYIIIAVILGLYFNHEKLYAHQRIGLIGAILTAIVLSIVTSS